MYVPEDNQSNALRTEPEFEAGYEVLLKTQSVSDSNHH